MNFIEIVFDKIESMNKSKFCLNDLAKYTGLQYGFDKKTLAQALKTLVKDGKLKEHKGGYYSINRARELKKCTILGTSKDYVFAREVGANGDNDIFISEANLNDACHGDTVMVEIGVSGKDRKYKRELPLIAKEKREGRVVEILQRGFEVVVGLLTINENGVALVFPDDRRFTDSVFVAPTDLNGATTNTKVVLEILDYPSRLKMARGRVREVLGDPGDAKVTTLSIIRSFNLFEEFPEDVEKEAKAVSRPTKFEKLDDRKDYRDELIITIDGEDARDFDDAISLKKVGDLYNLGVYIADVSHYVKEGSKLDAEAFKRGTSVYFPDHVLPMLPVELSNGICSLNPNEDRLCLAVEMVLNNAGKVIDYEIHKGVMNSSYRMTYTKVTKILNGDKELSKEYEKIVPMLFIMQELAKILIERRDTAGELDFDIPEPVIKLDDDGNVIDVYKKPREMSDRIIEQFMVLTNEIVARHFDKLELPFVYRVHETPTPLKTQRFKAFASSLGLKFTSQKDEVTPRDFQILLKKSKNEDYSTALSKVMLRSMQKARYDTENLGHFGLALKNYCHFTSPIRRYPDLSIHRIITAYLDGTLTEKKIREFEEFVESSAERSSTMERRAEEAERTVDEQKETEYMQTKIGEVFNGIISGVTENGIYVELDNTIEGFISTARLPVGKYEYDENHYLLKGVGQTYRIGDKIEIRVVSTDIALRRIDFELSSFHREVSEEELTKKNRGESKFSDTVSSKGKTKNTLKNLKSTKKNFKRKIIKRKR